MKKDKILIILSLFLLTGCYNYRELNDLAIATAVGIDKTKDGYNVIFQIINTVKTSSDDNSTSNPKIIIYEEEGKTLQEAARKIVLKSPKRIYGNHITLLIISEEVAKDGIKDVLDFLFRDPESRKQYQVMISRNSNSKSILEILTPLENINSESIVNSVLSDSQYLGRSEDVTFEQLMDMYINNDTEIVLPSIILKGETDEGEKKENLEESNPHSNVILSDMAIFKNDKLLGYANEEESIGLSYIRGKLENTVITYQCSNNKDKYLSIELIDVKTKKSAKKNKLEIDINISGNGNIAEIYCDVNLEKNDTIIKLEKELEEKIKKQIDNSIKSINQRFTSDIYEFKDLFHKTNPTLFKKIKDNYYEKYFNNIKVSTKVDITLTEKGNITRVIENEK